MTKATPKGQYDFQELPIDKLQISPANARTHSEDQVAQIAGSIREFGFTNPVLVSHSLEVIAGHGRLAAARLLDRPTVPCLILHDLTDIQVRALRIADNKLALNAAWDAELLSAELTGLREVGVDVHLLGFDDEELMDVWGVEPMVVEEPGGQDNEPPAEPETERGEILELGPHRVLCGDSTDVEDVQRLMAAADGGIDLTITSPPYNIDLAYREHGDKMDRATYLQFIRDVACLAYHHMADGRFICWNIGVSPKTFPAAQVVTLEDVGFTFKRQIIWAKCGVPYPTYAATRSAREARHYTPNYVHEVIQLMHKGKAPVYGGPIDVDEAFRDDIWKFSQSQATVDLKTVATKPMTFTGGPGSHGKPGHMLKEHPAAFPLALPRACIGILTSGRELVYDPFLGSGTTLIAAEQMGRRCVGMERDPGYCDIIRRRYNTLQEAKQS